MLSNVFERALADEKTKQKSMSIASGPGAPMFEPGPTTRIRRAPVRAIASVTVDGGPREIFGQVLNVSPGGCLLKTEATMETGTLVDMSITVIGDGFRARVDCKGVLRRREESGTRKHYGVEFLAVDSQDKQSLQWLYAQAMR
ncbi:PilZ domain-containing protein [Persicimonas caeni]|jgi:hypothetical protein|uniref:PilZ domain-containing protein n=1 Tax=Persicimonas caeni TaxID=2292766 RepID=A0A4Y6PNX7_PERCE|nr:PilZ domain-containing protein [Persicimonas caeni]QDG49707.1 PilZ domain-containing protein [Persicimonas caeni]QED30928.1 PilZ domain-containing protein [Persicimonas caeni]